MKKNINKQKKRLLLSSVVFVCLLVLLLYCMYQIQTPSIPVSPNVVLPNPVSANTVSTNTGSTNTVSTNTVSANDGVLAHEDLSYADTEKETSEEEITNPDRITYQDGFYYEPITDPIKERIYGLSYKEDCPVPYEDLRYVVVAYYDFNQEIQTGELICNKAIAKDLVEIFYELYQNAYEIEQIKLVDEFNADDDLSCAANNTSCFNYRTVYGSNTISKHGLGMAIDINPFYNPYVTYPNGVERISPPGSEPYANRSNDFPHKIDKDDLCYQLFTDHGFIWGGNWNSLKDYQHFQKE